MHVGDFFFHRPKLAFAIQTLTACALGYLTHVAQQQWYRENYLLLHISVWWILLVLVLVWFAERPRPRPTASAFADPERWSKQFRLNAILQGTAPWHCDERSEALTDDMPRGEPLFQSICLRMPDQWQLDKMETSIRDGMQLATFGRVGRNGFQLEFGEWEVGWCITVMPFAQTTEDDVLAFLQDLQHVLESTEGVTSVRWFHDEMLQGGQMEESHYNLGIASPVEPRAKSGAEM